MITVSRAQWNARPWTSFTLLDWSRVTKFIVHYSGASRSQTVRGIQDFCMDNKGHSDIDYNDVVKDGKRFIGRGNHVGGHTKDNNSTSYGVCVVGQDGDATPEDMNCVREIYDELCAFLGRQLTVTDHRTVLGASYTDCPGSELHAWVVTGMPYTGGSVATINQEDWDNLRWRNYSTDVAGSDVALGGPAVGQEMWQPKFLKALDRKVDALTDKVGQLSVPAPAPVDPIKFKEVLLNPDVLQAIARAVVAEIAS